MEAVVDRVLGTVVRLDDATIDDIIRERAPPGDVRMVAGDRVRNTLSALFRDGLSIANFGSLALEMSMNVKQFCAFVCTLMENNAVAGSYRNYLKHIEIASATIEDEPGSFKLNPMVMSVAARIEADNLWKRDKTELKDVRALMEDAKTEAAATMLLRRVMRDIRSLSVSKALAQNPEDKDMIMRIHAVVDDIDEVDDVDFVVDAAEAVHGE